MPLVDGISRKNLELLAIKTLVGAKTMAFTRVFSPHPWPTKPEFFPAIIVQAPFERKIAIGRGIKQFNTTIRLVVVARVWQISAEQAQSDLDLISGQIEEALLCTNEFANNVQQFTTIETQSVVNADSRDFIGEVGLSIECEVYQVFAPAGVPLLGVSATITNGPSGETMATAKVTFPPPSQSPDTAATRASIKSALGRR
jgi:hypothetical protein